MKTMKAKTDVKTENSELVDLAVHCRVALDCYTPKLQRAALEAIVKLGGKRLSVSDIKAVCSDLSDKGHMVLDVLIGSILDSLTDIVLEDKIRVVKALLEQLPDEEKKFAERAETDRLLDKILNDILGKLSNAQLETILKDVKASDNYTMAFVLAVTNPELAELESKV